MFSTSLKVLSAAAGRPVPATLAIAATMVVAAVHAAPLVSPQPAAAEAMPARAAIDVPAFIQSVSAPLPPSNLHRRLPIPTATVAAPITAPAFDRAPQPKPRPHVPTIVGQVGDLKLLNLAAVRTGAAPVQRALYAELPAEYHDIASVDRRKGAFFSVVLPLVLMANEEVLADRRRLARIFAVERTGGQISAGERAWLNRLAADYATDPQDIGELLRRVDMVPAALALAQAAEESGWGQSRFARQGNALFGEWTWTESEGIVPAGRPIGETYAVKSFDTLLDSVRSYLRNLNTNSAYAELRAARAAMRAGREDIDAARLAGTLQRYSQRGDDYVSSLRTIIRANDLGAFSTARLEPAGA